MYKAAILGVFWFVFSICLMAQNLDWVWASRGGGSGVDNARAIATDSEGNQYACGLFQGSATFGSTTLTSSGSYDVWLAKQDSAGNWIWAVRAGGTGGDIGVSIATDWSNNVYMAGGFEGTVLFGSISLTAVGAQDRFIAKLDSGGNWLWVKQASGCNCNELALDASGNVYLTGTFSGTASFGSYSVTSAGYTDAYVAKLSSSGSWLWVRRGGGTNYESSFCIAVDNASNLYLGGSFEGTATFGGTPSLTAVGSWDVFVAKLDSDGNWLWSRRGGGTSYEDPIGIATDASANVYVMGYYNGNASTAFGSTTLTGMGGWDIWLAKLDSAGNWLWANKMGGSANDFCTDMVVTAPSSIYLTGYYYSQPANFGATPLACSGNNDVFVARLDGNGTCLQALRAGDVNYDSGYGIAVDLNSNVYITGNFSGTTIIGDDTLSSAGSSDIFIARLSPPSPMADFAADVTSGPAPLAVQFTDLSQPGMGDLSIWLWMFGDGNGSNAQNPQHTYENPGQYSVTLMVWDEYGAFASLERTGYITVVTGGIPLAPANPGLVMAGDDAILTWDPVTEDQNGQPLTPDHYLIWYNPAGADTTFTQLGQASDTSYTHVGAGQLMRAAYYRITAVKLYRKETSPTFPRRTK